LLKDLEAETVKQIAEINDSMKQKIRLKAKHLVIGFEKSIVKVC
jgi:hypothetical protein